MCALKGKEMKLNESPGVKSLVSVDKNQKEDTEKKKKDSNEEDSLMKEKTEEITKTKERVENVWSEVSPGRIGRSQSLQNKSIEIQISASKFSVLIDEEEEGLILEDNLKDMDEDREEEEVDNHESEFLEENFHEQLVQDNVKIGGRRGRKKGQKTKAQDPIPAKSMRSSRRKS